MTRRAKQLSVAVMVLLVILILTTPRTPASFLAEPDASGELQLVHSPRHRKVVAEIQGKLTELLGPSWYRQPLRVRVDEGLEKEGEFRQYGCKRSPADLRTEIWLRRSGSDAIAHELAHAYLGCYRLMDERFYQGMAEGAAQITMFSAYSWDTAFHLTRFEYANMNRRGIGNGSCLVCGDTPLGWVRYSMAGTAFRQYEYNHPGFMRAFMAALYDHARNRYSLEGEDLVGLGEAVSPGFAEWFSMQHVFEEGEPGKHILAIPNEYRVNLYGLIRDEDGEERPWMGQPFKVTVVDDGRVVKTVSGRIRSTGTAGFSLPRPADDNYIIYLRSGDYTETVFFRTSFKESELDGRVP